MTALDTNPISLPAIREQRAAHLIADARRKHAPDRLYTWRAKGGTAGDLHGGDHLTQTAAMEAARGDWTHIVHGPTKVGPDRFVMRVYTPRVNRVGGGVTQVERDVEYRGRPVEIDHDAVIGEFHRRLADGDPVTEDGMQLIVDVLRAHSFGNERDLLDALDDLLAVLAR